ncbi:valine-tRNA ligase [Kwoniella mangroviensis CBS 8507]|uniref:valine-tRNA ligase n=1 Tax=Kwoniella mangroviensis CBS 8507 TaxID=1296122 RepID=UPI00080D2785|nr:valine-tRNA ligase [Kwoniella mangroviensis CBS 8507]OCF65966.1 valine-tRNA ligase [Kwoniella mangroviensis CBS 8507]
MSSEEQKVAHPPDLLPAVQANPAEGAAAAVAPGSSAEGGKEQSKNAAKKEAKRLEKLALKAAKGPAVAQGAKKDKSEKKEKKVEAPVEEWVNTTPKGEKKDVSGNLPAGYDPIQVEAAHYDWWNAKGFFKPRYGPDGKPVEKGTFCITFPPPNVTGNLHIGHALTVSIQDAMIRWKRMQGYTVLYLPGYDHAGIATQAVVEQRLMKTEGHSRHHYGREKFLEKVWDWKDQYQTKITNQMERLGGSFDWDRVAFTMDESLSKAVRETFCILHDKGLIYRANRLVNWCCYLNTSLSNLEVDQMALTGRTLLNVKGYDAKEKFEFGVITSFAYPIENSDERIIVATTRPETMLGDTAIAVHPDDPRYTHLHGRFAVHPFNNRRIPIITDAITVDMEFGTGAVKITPAHDPNDFECGQRNNLEFISLMNDDGTYNENAAPYQGMKRFHIRNEIIKALKEKGLYVEQKDNEMQIPICSRSGDVVEQILKPQWWVSCQPMAEDALKRTRAGELEIKPKTSASDWVRWMENMQDWCISRQLWWGHRCPAYLIKYDGEAPDTGDDKNWIVARSFEEADARAKEQANGRKYTLEQDEDVLDTWFSSALWPFSTMGWPDKTADVENFYPNSILETGWDIIFFWVARMVFFGNALTGKMPFKEVYCHPMIRDAYGRKMSKSLGNVIDPLDVITGQNLQKLHNDLRMGNLPEKEIAKAEDGQKKLFPKGIPQCGTDALRFTLCNYTSGGRDINMDIGRVEGYRKFCNKLWNATKFCLFRMDLVDLNGVRQQSTFVPNASPLPTGQEGLVEKWLFHKLNLASAAVSKALEAREFSDATNAAYQYFLNDLCDVFIEATKPLFEANTDAASKLSAQNTLYTCLEGGLKLLHPFMPYVTEDLWQRLPRREGDKCETIMLAPFPEYISQQEFPEAAAEFDVVVECIKAARSIVGLYNLPTNIKTIEDKITVIVQVKTTQQRQLLESQESIIIGLTKGCGTVKFITDDSEVPTGCGTEFVTTDINVHIPVAGKVNASAEVDKLQKKSAIVESNKNKLIKLIEQPNYETTIKEEVRNSNSEKLQNLEVEIETLRLAIERFQAIL